MKHLSLEDISVRFGRVRALDRATVELRAGEVLLLAGPNGAGKSTLLKVLLGLVKPEGGQVKVDGRATAIDNSFKEQLGYLPEAVAFPSMLSGRQTLRFFARARNVTRERVEEALRLVGLEDAARRAVRGYSRGMRQRLGLAVAVLSDPHLLILDEPTGGLDQQGISVLSTVIEEWRSKGRMTLISSHDLALLERRVDRVCILKEGRAIADGRPEQLRRRTDLPTRVHFEFADQANGERKAFVADVTAAGAAGELTQSDNRVSLSVSSDAVLQLLDIRSSHNEAITHVRIEEPQLDAVYEHLLTGGQ